MNSLKFLVVLIVVALLATAIEAKKKKHKASSSGSLPTKTKTKTKWSTSTDLAANGVNSMVATEEHGYYVKRTFLPLMNASDDGALATLRGPPFLAIPIAWFSCDGDCTKGNSALINGNANAIAEGFLCDDDCTEPYEPICGKTNAEIAVFYNKCKLNVAKCRTHGLWTEQPYEECQRLYPNEIKYTDKKFRSSPYFRDGTTTIAAVPVEETTTIESSTSKEEPILEEAPVTLAVISERFNNSVADKPDKPIDKDEEENVTSTSTPSTKTTKGTIAKDGGSVNHNETIKF